ncbi:hypothetical protein MY11210_004935 [Beauveria gryllotalpidicola]
MLKDMLITQAGSCTQSIVKAMAPFILLNATRQFTEVHYGDRLSELTGGKIPPSNGVYNRAGRAFPDISALGDNAVIAYDWGVGFGAGTSLSTPIVAAIFTRINEELIAVGKPPIGFANPALYANPGMLNDVTVGSQDDDYGVGLGTPNYPAMLKYFLSVGDEPPGLNSSFTAQEQ